MRWLLMGMSGCASLLGPSVEGDEAEECRDGADNDQNGQFDCDDPGCVGSPDCPSEPGSTDQPTEEPTGSQEAYDDAMGAYCGTGAPAVTDVSSVDVTLELSFVIDGAFQYLLDDCTATYEGSAGGAVSEGDCVTFDGDWTLAESDCSAKLLPDKPQLVWVNLQQDDAYHTLYFTDGGTRLDAWIAHGDRRHGVPDPAFTDQFWVTEIDSDVTTSETAQYTESTPLMDGALRLGTLDITLHVSLDR